MVKAKTKGISFSPKYQNEYEYVMGIKDASKYVCELIRKDLKAKEGIKKCQDELEQCCRDMEFNR